MSEYRFTFCGVDLEASPSGALYAPGAKALVVSDLHLGRAERIARREGRLVPPYETRETLMRLDALIAALKPEIVICLGDSFDDNRAAEAIGEAERDMLRVMQAGRRWIWIAGNHDPAPVGFSGDGCDEIALAGLTFRHEAARGARAEVSGHFHPKVRLRGPGRPAFLVDERRIIMPAFGAYTGGLDVTDAAFDEVIGPEAVALITGRKIIAAPRAPMLPGYRRSA
ncbi:MAG: ligase-associated DNA damage response endonuclease PdeM [Pseudomonadota bacterium]